MPYVSFDVISPKANALFASLPGMVLKSAAMVREGMEFVYENEDERVTLRFLPQVYTLGKNIVDPINDLTLRMEVQRVRLNADPQAKVEKVGSVEMAFSSWLGESYL